MEITKLRLVGFKSFVDPVELVIEPGLTGVVGPNGCGKSNLLEALRWVMGETSYKTLRGSAMEDVIFSGTQNRASRNWAEVTIFLDNRQRKAPPAFNDADQLEVTRRIERDAGSDYRINGKPVRARDVQLLFADAATGARSPALVQQGRIGEIVAAKPQQRRRILEEAAGITGLHSRRHEAELRLGAAENNLARLEDILEQMRARLRSLQRQAAQARRYKSLSAELRKREAQRLYLAWEAARNQVRDAETQFELCLREVGSLTGEESRLRRAEADAQAKLPPLREAEMVAAALVQRLTIARQRLEEDGRRRKLREEDLQRQKVQLTADLEREKRLVAEAEAQLAQLEDEARSLRQAEEAETDAQTAAAKLLAETAKRLAEQEAALARVTEALAERRARQKALESRFQAESDRIARLEAVKADLQQQLVAAEQDADAQDALKSQRDAVARLESSLAAAERTQAEAEKKLEEARQAEAEVREAQHALTLRLGTLEGEKAALAKLWAPEANQSDQEPVMATLSVTPGYEKAVGAALGDDLSAPLGETAPAHWKALPPLVQGPDLPEGVEPLAHYVTAPSALARRLAQTGLVRRADGPHLQTLLQPGQRLVSREGDLWRWDGFTMTAEAPTAAARSLAARNRLEALDSQLARLKAEKDALSQQLAARKQVRQDSEMELANVKKQLRALRQELARKQKAYQDAERQADRRHHRIASVSDRLRHLEDDLKKARQAKAEIEQALATLPPVENLSAQWEKQQATLAELRAAHIAAQSAHALHEREKASRAARLSAIAKEKSLWQKRRDEARTQWESLTRRREKVLTELTELTENPQDHEAQLSRLDAELAAAEARRKAALADVQDAEDQLRTATKALRALQETLTQAREAKARAEAQLEAARQTRTERARAISESLGCPPEACREVAELGEPESWPSLVEVDDQIARLTQSRDRLGAVNLRAEAEAETVKEEVASLEAEKTDLESAIARLRGAIGSLNREARKRLLTAFDQVNDHFRALFTTLFGGGKAELRLVDADDPLEAGLEILAAPPGKKPQVLTLLSGGEKALTALALIFAVFLTNPSPICVLDEVDAPLDDANVERFCQLLEEMCRKTQTRFLVITHHPMTMARMTRLFGVTMAERGVSQLVSVDLEAAERFRESA